MLVTPGLKSEDRYVPGAHWLSISDQKERFRFRERPYLITFGKDRGKISVFSGLNMHMHGNEHTWTQLTQTGTHIHNTQACKM